MKYIPKERNNFLITITIIFIVRATSFGKIIFILSETFVHKIYSHMDLLKTKEINILCFYVRNRQPLSAKITYL